LLDTIARSDVSPRIVAAFEGIDRADFVPTETVDPYVDKPIEIPEHQTTSQPSLIAQMVDAADLLPGDKALEIGTGFGFQTALMAALTGDVVSIERHPSISAAAAVNLKRAGIEGVRLVVGDGWNGVPDLGPYEAIVVSAAAAWVPEAFVDQMVEGARLVIPVRGEHGDEVWVHIRRNGHLLPIRMLTPARFVPLVPGEVDQSNE
jgi:protein-L-isoaspartate(D-aspartate) O-methyltransferase